MSAANETTHWFVESPAYPYTEWVCAEGGPTYDIRDWTEVDAPTRREAVTAAVKEWLAENHDNWSRSRRADGRCPFTGVKAVSVAEAKAETFANGPPKWAPEFCDFCTDAHPDAVRWVWKDEGESAGEEWGWFGTCAGVELRESSTGSQA